MYAAIRAAAASTRRGAEIPNTRSAPRTLVVKALSARIALLALLGGLGLTTPALEHPAAAQSSDHAIVTDGEAVVSGFSGASAMTPTPQGVDPVAVTFIDPNGLSARVIDLRGAGGPPQAQVLPAPNPSSVTAAQVGQVSAVTLNGLGAGRTCACGGPPAPRKSMTRAERPLGSMKVTATGSTPCGVGVIALAPEKPLTTASPSVTIA